MNASPAVKGFEAINYDCRIEGKSYRLYQRYDQELIPVDLPEEVRETQQAAEGARYTTDEQRRLHGEVNIEPIEAAFPKLKPQQIPLEVYSQENKKVPDADPGEEFFCNRDHGES